MANIHQEQHSIRNMQVVSSIRVHSTHSCEANKSRNSKPFFACGRSRTSSRSHQKKKLKKIILKVPFLPLKIAFFWVSGNAKNFRSKSYMVTKSEISPQRKLGSLRNLRLFLIRYELISVLIFGKIRALTRAQEP